MTLVSFYLADTERLYETCEAIDKSKEKFSNNPSVSSGNSSVGAITSKINELGNEIKKDYETTSKSLRNYTNKVEANENKLKSKAVSVLENASVVKNIPVMVTDSKTGTSEKTKETFADSIKPRIENNINVNMLNSLEVAQGIVKTYEGQVKTTKKEETLKDIADEFFENQRKSGVFPGSAINSQNNGAFASSVGNLNSVNKAIEVDPERIVKAKENTDKINTIAKEKRFEEEKNQAYIINDISDAVGTALGNPISVIGNIKDGVFSVAKIGGYAYSGVKSLFTGEKLTDVANETIEKISDTERKVDDEIIGAKLFVSEGVYSTVENLVKGVAVISGFVPTKLSSIALNEIDNATGWNYKELFEQKVSKILGTNWVHDKFSSFYEENGYGNHLKDNLIGFDTQRNIGNTVGAAIPTIAAGLATGGTGSIIVGGLSSTGSGTTTALQEGATLDEATNYGAAKGALSAATFGAGKAINTLNIFGRGTVAQTLENAGARVLADTGLGAVTSLADDVLKQLYVPRNKFNDKNFGFSSEEEWTKASFGDKFNAYFNDAGGWESIKSGAITGAVYSTVFEGISAVKEISSINAANKVYSDIKSNIEEVNNIKNQNMLNENDSVASNSLEDLYAQRKSIQEAYDSLDDQAKYFFQLKRAKDGIASGAITSAGIDNFINSGMVKAMYGDLNNQERLSLIDKMNQTQLESFFNQIGKTKAQAFLNRNSTYFTERFFNTDNTNSTWTNNTSIITSSNPINGLQIQNPGSLTGTTSSINDSLKYQRTGLFQYTLDYLKSNINKFSYKNTNTINGLNDEIKNNGLYHFTTAGDEILESGYIRASGVNASYGNKKTFFFNGVPDVGAIASNLDEVPLKAEAIKVNPTDEMLNDSKLKVRAFDDQAISYDGNVDLTNLEATKEYFCLFQEGDELVYKVVSKDYYDNYQNTTSGKKVEQLLSDSESVKAIKEDYYRSLSLNSTNASKGSATSISLIHESDIPQTIDSVSEADPKVRFSFLKSLKTKQTVALEEDYLHEIDEIIENFGKTTSRDDPRYETLSLIDQNVKDDYRASEITRKVNSLYDKLNSKRSELSKEIAGVTTTSSGSEVYPKITEKISQAKDEITKQISELENISSAYKNSGGIFSKEKGISKVYDKVKGDYEALLKDLDSVETGITVKNKAFIKSIENIEDIPAETPNSNSTGVLGKFLKPLFKSNIEPTLEQKVDLYKTRINNYEEDYFASVDKMIEEFDVSAVDSNTKNEALLLIDKKIGDSPIAGAVSNEVKSYYEDLSSKAGKLAEDMAKVSTSSISVDKSSQELAKRIETVKEELETTISDLDKKGIRYRNNYSIFSKERGLSKVYDKVKGDYEDFYKKIEILEEKLAGKKAVLDSSIEQLGETTFNEKDQSKIKEIISSLEQKPSEEIIDIESIPRKRNLTTELARERSGLSESTDTTSKIGFQFFANKKAENLYNANDMPLATDPKFRRLQDKIANGESLSMFERASFRDKTYKNIGDYECKPNYCYRAISKEVYDIYKEKGYIVGYDNDKEYQEFVDEDGSSWNNNAGVDWYLGGYAKYGTIIIECPAYKDYFVPAFDGGNHMTSDITVKHMKSSPEQNPIPFSKITRVFDLSKIKEDTESTSNIGFQFFATPKKSGNIISNLLNPTSRAIDTFFKDFDNGTDTYGADQNFGRKDTIYVTTGNSLGISRNKFYSYLSRRHPKLSLEELQRRWMISSDQRIEIYDPEEYISYIAERQAVLNNGVKDINKAIDTFESMTEKVPSDEYLKSQKFLMNKGMTRKESIALLYEVNSTGICSYASVANDILTSFRYNPREFKEKFGFSMYTYSDGKRVINSNELMLDLYTYANSQSTNPASILRIDANGELHINNLDTSSQKFMSDEGLKIVDSYLKSKDSSLSYNYKEEVITPTSVAAIKSKIKTALKEGNVGLGINGSKKNRENANSINIKLKGTGVTRFLDESGKVFRDTKRWAIGDGHAVFVTGYNEQGVIVSSWGRRLIIPYEDLADSFFSIRTSVIGGIK